MENNRAKMSSHYAEFYRNQPNGSFSQSVSPCGQSNYGVNNGNDSGQRMQNYGGPNYVVPAAAGNSYEHYRQLPSCYPPASNSYNHIGGQSDQSIRGVPQQVGTSQNSNPPAGNWNANVRNCAPQPQYQQQSGVDNNNLQIQHQYQSNPNNYHAQQPNSAINYGSNHCSSYQPQYHHPNNSNNNCSGQYRRPESVDGFAQSQSVPVPVPIRSVLSGGDDTMKQQLSSHFNQHRPAASDMTNGGRQMKTAPVTEIEGHSRSKKKEPVKFSPEYLQWYKNLYLKNLRTSEQNKAFFLKDKYPIYDGIN